MNAVTQCEYKYKGASREFPDSLVSERVVRDKDALSKRRDYYRACSVACLLLLWSGVFLSGCAGLDTLAVSSLATTQVDPVQFTKNHILVNYIDLHKDAPKPVGQPSSSYRVRGGKETWGASPDVRQIKAEVERDYDLHSVDEWPIKVLSLHCVVYQVPSDYSMENLLKELASDARVESVQPMQVFKSLAKKYNDPYLKLQHAAQSMGIVAAHEISRGRGVKVAIIDTGMDVSHPEIRERITQMRNFVSHDSEAFSGDIHGTAIAGVIASTVNNAIGIVGVAPEVDIFALKACWPKKTGSVSALCSSFTLALAITFAIENNVDILNLSLSGPSDTLLARLIDVSIKRGMVVVAATPEEGPVGFPASIDRVIAVNTDIGYPSKSQTNLVSAPGSEILTTIPHGGYDFLSGTSLAAAHVSGIIALLLERDPSLSIDNILGLLRAPGYNGRNLSLATTSVSAYGALAKLASGSEIR